MDCGFKVWLDMGVILKHSGNALYPLRHQEQKLLVRHTRHLNEAAGSTQNGTADTVSIPAGETVSV
jgi:hypothetical protein